MVSVGETEQFPPDRADIHELRGPVLADFGGCETLEIRVNPFGIEFEQHPVQHRSEIRIVEAGLGGARNLYQVCTAASAGKESADLAVHVRDEPRMTDTAGEMAALAIQHVVDMRTVLICSGFARQASAEYENQQGRTN